MIAELGATFNAVNENDLRLTGSERIIPYQIGELRGADGRLYQISRIRHMQLEKKTQ